MSQTTNSSFVWATKGPASGSASIAKGKQITRVLIEPPIQVEVIGYNERSGESDEIQAFLYANGEAKGPYYSSHFLGGKFLLHSLWSELRNWIGDKSLDQAGILIGFTSDPDRQGVWLPIESPVPDPVILQPSPHLKTSVRFR